MFDVVSKDFAGMANMELVDTDNVSSEGDIVRLQVCELDTTAVLKRYEKQSRDIELNRFFTQSLLDDEIAKHLEEIEYALATEVSGDVIEALLQPECLSYKTPEVALISRPQFGKSHVTKGGIYYNVKRREQNWDMDIRVQTLIAIVVYDLNEWDCQ